jgi:hypothetical protein
VNGNCSETLRAGLPPRARRPLEGDIIAPSLLSGRDEFESFSLSLSALLRTGVSKGGPALTRFA